MRGAALAITLVASTAAAVGQDSAAREVRTPFDSVRAPLAQAQRGGRAPREPAATATIRGRVFAADTGVPLRRALVSAQGGGRPVVTQTDFEGRFEVRVPPGRWSLAAAKAGYVTLQLGQRRAFESVPPVQIGAGERFDNADFALPRGGSISGRVVDELGDPVLDARVRVLRYQMVRGRKQLSSAGIAVTTDDRGVYRLYGLAPGEYYVSAAAETRPLDRGDEQPLKYASTFFPGTPDIGSAQRITVDIGDEQENVNFSLQPVRIARVSGTVVDASGEPAGPGTVALTSAFDSSDGSVPIGANARIAADGTFVLTDVVPGSYTLVARSRGRGRRSGPAERPSMAYLPLVVPGDIDAVTVTLTSGATLTGTIAVSGRGTLPSGNIRIAAQPLSSAIGFGQLTANITNGGAGFSIEGLIGPVMFRPSQLPAGWMLDRIEINGVDVTDTYVEFRGTETALGRIVLTDEIPEVNGLVRAAGAPPDTGYHVVIFPSDASKWTFPSRHVHATRTDQEGSFSVRGLPPSDRYLAVAVDYLEEDQANDPDFLQAIRGSATSFSVKPGESRFVELDLVER